MKKERQVHMLPIFKNGALSVRISSGVITPYTQDLDELYKPQHLYITSDEKKKVGDWIINKNGDTLMCVSEIGASGLPDWSKVIASTDPKLTGNQPKSILMQDFVSKVPQSFVKEYCEKGGIDKVMVEYELIQYKKKGVGKYNHPEYYEWEPKLIDNTVIITELKEKMYNVEELKNFGLFLGRVPKKQKFRSIDSLFEEWSK